MSITRRMAITCAIGAVFPRIAMAAPALISGAHVAFGAPSNAPTTSSALNTTGASLLLLGINQYDVDPNTDTVTDSKGNTWLHLVSRTNPAGENNVTIFYAWQSLSVGAGHTVTLTGNFSGAVFAAFSGTQITSTPLDQQNGSAQNAAVSPDQFGSITPSVAGTLVVSLFGVGGSATLPFAGTSLTLVDSIAPSPGNFEGVGMGYVVQTSAVAVNPAWTWGNPVTQQAAGINVSFKSTATAVSTRASQGFTF